LGTYAHHESGWLIRLEWRDRKLSVIGPGSRQSGEKAVFRRLADGRVASIFLAASTFGRLDQVVEPKLI
jgi:hypothetical protein